MMLHQARRVWSALCISAGVAVALAGCVSTARPDARSHQLLVTPASSNAAIFIVGVEKYAASIVGRIDQSTSGGCGSNTRCVDIAQLTASDARQRRFWGSRLDDGTQMVVSHVLRLEGAQCELIAPKLAEARCPAPGALPDPTATQGWEAIDQALFAALDREIRERRATHLFVLATGWNTRQERSLTHFNEWAQGLADNLGETIRPVFIGLTWPAGRDGIPYIHFRNKAHDSDEVGLTWANLLVNRTLSRLRTTHGTQTVLIGHSYGARLLSTAAFAGEALSSGCRDGGGPDLLIGLQPAFSTSRFNGPSDAVGAYVYRRDPPCPGVAVYTASNNDRSVAWAPSQLFFRSRRAYVGSRYALELARETPGAPFATGLVDHAGALSPPEKRSALVLLDASAHIAGHNDVYDAEAVRLISDIVRTYVPVKPTSP